MTQRILLAMILSCGMLRHSFAADDTDKPAAAAYAILEKYCGTCHHEQHRGNKDYEVLSLKSLLETKPTDRVLEKFPGAKAFVVPQKPDESLVWLRTGVKKDMPPRNPKPTDEELKALKKWIEDGAKSQ